MQRSYLFSSLLQHFLKTLQHYGNVLAAKAFINKQTHK